MAIYSLHHSAIGKSTQPRVNTSAAHIRYISRRRACSMLLGAHMPVSSGKAQNWMRREEKADRKNARVCDKILLALPKELTVEQRAELVNAYATAVTKGRTAWLGAIHDRGKDTHNPHCHLIVRDRDIETGKRVCEMSERGSTERLRELWEYHANLALQRANRPERIDRRTLRAQGIERRPTIHEGLSAREMVRNGRPARSKERTVRNAPGAQSKVRKVDYRRIDRGLSRPQYNQRIRETQAELWRAIDVDNIVREWRHEDSAVESPTDEGAAFREKFAKYQAERRKKSLEKRLEPERELRPQKLPSLKPGLKPGLP